MKIAGKRDPEYLARKAAREARRQAQGRFANAGALDGLVEYLAFEFPRGSGITWRVPPIDYRIGHRITELELELCELQAESEAIQKQQAAQVEAGEPVGPDTVRLRKISERWASVVERGVKLAGPLMIPTGRWRWRYKILRALKLQRHWRNPLERLGAQAKDVAWVIGFLALCQMNSPVRARHLGDVSLN